MGIWLRFEYIRGRRTTYKFDNLIELDNKFRTFDMRDFGTRTLNSRARRNFFVLLKLVRIMHFRWRFEPEEKT